MRLHPRAEGLIEEVALTLAHGNLAIPYAVIPNQDDPRHYGEKEPYCGEWLWNLVEDIFRDNPKLARVICQTDLKSRVYRLVFNTNVN